MLLESAAFAADPLSSGDRHRLGTPCRRSISAEPGAKSSAIASWPRGISGLLAYRSHSNSSLGRTQADFGHLRPGGAHGPWEPAARTAWQPRIGGRIEANRQHDRAGRTPWRGRSVYWRGRRRRDGGVRGGPRSRAAGGVELSCDERAIGPWRSRHEPGRPMDLPAPPAATTSYRIGFGRTGDGRYHCRSVARLPSPPRDRSGPTEPGPSAQSGYLSEAQDGLRACGGRRHDRPRPPSAATACRRRLLPTNSRVLPRAPMSSFARAWVCLG